MTNLKDLITAAALDAFQLTADLCNCALREQVEKANAISAKLRSALTLFPFSAKDEPTESHEARRRSRPERVYICGPISGQPKLNRQAFYEAEMALLKAGFEPVNPHRNGLPQSAAWREHMKLDLALLLRCDRLAYLVGSENSKGATLERYVANQVGIPESLIFSLIGADGLTATVQVEEQPDQDVAPTHLEPALRSGEIQRQTGLAWGPAERIRTTIEAICLERANGIRKFGVQASLPLRDSDLHEHLGFERPERMAEHYEIPSEARAKFLLTNAMHRLELTWPHIVIEELAEAVGARSFAEMRTEVVQLAATCLGWLEAIDHQHPSAGELDSKTEAIR